MTLRLMLYAHDWAPLIGGIQTVCTGLAKGITAWSKAQPSERIEVTLVTQTAAEADYDLHSPFAVVRRPSLRRLIELIRSANVLHIAGPAILPLAIGWILRKPIVIEHDGYQSVCPNGLLIYGPDYSVCPGHFMAARYADCVRCNSRSEGWIRSLRGVILTFVRRWLAKKATVNVAPSRHIGRRIELPRTQIIHHGVPEAPPAVKGSSGNQEGTATCFAYVGRLTTEKGLPVLLRACRELADRGYEFRLKILGDGTERSYLQGLARELHLEAYLQFVGSVPVDAISDQLTNTSAVVMPSIWEDVAPLVASEQMMQGRLLIASDIGGLGEIVDGYGLKFPAGDVSALASCMRRVIEDPSLARKLGANAQIHASEVFAEKRTIEDHLNLYRNLVRA
jgi:glycosyltransferase involved in cell wall biosynthesis